MTDRVGVSDNACGPAADTVTWAALGSSSVPLDNPFPLKRFPREGLSKRRDLSAPCRNRFARRQRLSDDLNSVIDAVNWLADSRLKSKATLDTDPCPDPTSRVHARILTAVKSRLCDAAIPEPRSAFLELTNGLSL